MSTRLLFELWGGSLSEGSLLCVAVQRATSKLECFGSFGQLEVILSALRVYVQLATGGGKSLTMFLALMNKQVSI